MKAHCGRRRRLFEASVHEEDRKSRRKNVAADAQLDWGCVVFTGVESPEAENAPPFPFADALKPETFEAARGRFFEHFASGSGPVVVDVSCASSIDFFGLQALLGAEKWASARNRTFSTVGAPESLRTLCRGLGLSIAGIEEQTA